MTGLRWIGIDESSPDANTHVLTVDMTEKAPLIWHNVYDSFGHFMVQYGERKPTHWAKMNFPRDKGNDGLIEILKDTMELLTYPGTISCQDGVVARCICRQCVMQRGRELLAKHDVKLENPRFVISEEPILFLLLLKVDACCIADIWAIKEQIEARESKALVQVSEQTLARTIAYHQPYFILDKSTIRKRENWKWSLEIDSYIYENLRGLPDEIQALVIEEVDKYSKTCVCLEEL